MIEEDVLIMLRMKASDKAIEWAKLYLAENKEYPPPQMIINKREEIYTMYVRAVKEFLEKLNP